MHIFKRDIYWIFFSLLLSQDEGEREMNFSCKNGNFHGVYDSGAKRSFSGELHNGRCN